MYRYTRKICKKCMLQEDTFHGIVINDEGLCSLCAKSGAAPARNWDEMQALFEGHLAGARGHFPYEGMIMMSGGKDSAYLAHMLKKRYDVNLLAFIIDNNYEYPETFENAVAIAGKLDMPYVLYRQDPQRMRRYYRFLFCEESIAQQDCGQVCTFCGRFLIRTAAEFARAMNIPLVFSGHNPEQIFLMGESMESDPERLTIAEFTMAMLEEDTQKATTAWTESFSESRNGLFPDALAPDGVTLLFPFQHFPYEPERMMNMVRTELDWRPIKRFSKTYIASGCRLVKLWAYLAHCGGTNNYVDFEFSSQVRQGTLSHETVKQFYSETAAELEELRELVQDLDMLEPMARLLRDRFGDDNGLLRLLTGKESGR